MADCAIRRLRSVPYLAATVCAIAALSLITSLFVCSRRGIPRPAVHDEFAYLLAGDTFAHGRLTNPTPRCWEHFETYHVFQRPTRQAKYPPGQGMFLAIGQRLFGRPIAGVWLSLALACGATVWALAGLVPLVWAVAGGLIAALNPQIVYWWGQSYWGGAVAMLGGALLFGGLFRFLRDGRPQDTAWSCLGLSIVANSRPESAAVLALICAVPYAVHLRDMMRISRERGLRNLAIVAGIGAISVGWLLWYNWRLGGNPFRYYYTLWNPAASPVAAVRAYTGSPPRSCLYRFVRIWDFYLPPGAPAWGFLGLVALWRDRRVWLSLFALVFCVAGYLGFTIAWPHYMAPVAILLYGLLAAGMWQLAGVRLAGQRVGLAVTLLLLAIMTQRFVHGVNGLSKIDWMPGWSHIRYAFADRLVQSGGKHLILVRYGPGHAQHAEWVYNGADMDTATVLWARDLGEPANQCLFREYPGRSYWLLKADRNPVRLQPLDPALPVPALAEPHPGSAGP